MQTASLVARFVEAFIAEFLGTMKDRIIDGGLVILTLTYWLLSGKLSAHFWESAAPWIWMFCAIIAWHSIRAAQFLYRNISTEGSSPRQRSIVLSRHGEPFELPAEKAGAYRAKIVVVCATLAALSIVASYAVSLAVRAEKVGPSAAATEPDLAIFMKCDMTDFPITIPALGVIRLVPGNEKYMRVNSWGSYEISNDSAKPKQWPEKQHL
jgi:hypothetical protein